jgi:hypothetical protein
MKAAVLPEPVRSQTRQRKSYVKLTSLGSRDDIVTGHDSGNGVSLNGSGDLIAAELDVFENNRVDACVLELVMVSGVLKNLQETYAGDRVGLLLSFSDDLDRTEAANGQ